MKLIKLDRVGLLITGNWRDPGQISEAVIIKDYGDKLMIRDTGEEIIINEDQVQNIINDAQSPEL